MVTGCGMDDIAGSKSLRRYEFQNGARVKEGYPDTPAAPRPRGFDPAARLFRPFFMSEGLPCSMRGLLRACLYPQ